MKYKKVIFTSMGTSIALFLVLILVLAPSIKRVVAEEVVLGAHRGAHSLPPENFKENTLEAFEKAVESDNYRFIEFDIQYTKDKTLVVHHDKSLLRLQKKPERIPDLTYEELLEVSDYHIPTYDETMELTAGKKPLNIEIKSQGNFEDDEAIADRIIKDCMERKILDSTLISSISNEVLIYIKENYPEVKTGKIYYIAESTLLNYEFATSELYNELDEADADFLMLHGCNLHNYGNLKKLLPEDKTLVIWYFTDEMYIVQPKTESWVFKLQGIRKLTGARDASGQELSRGSVRGYVGNKEEGCGWWCQGA
ncbi:MAG: glycerophosphodiester phosphodiesterase [archaeon]